MAKGKYAAWLTERGLGQIEAWAGDGLTNEEIAANIGVNADTLYRWLKKHDEISEAITRGRGGAQVQIENALFLRATGGVKTLQKPMKRRVREYNEAGKCTRDEEIIEQVTEEVYIAPDTAAIKFWLMNRAPERWAEKVEITGDGRLKLEDLIPHG